MSLMALVTTVVLGILFLIWLGKPVTEMLAKRCGVSFKEDSKLKLLSAQNVSVIMIVGAILCFRYSGYFDPAYLEAYRSFVSLLLSGGLNSLCFLFVSLQLIRLGAYVFKEKTDMKNFGFAISIVLGIMFMCILLIESTYYPSDIERAIIWCSEM